MNRRQDRINRFKEFHKNARSLFKNISSGDQSHERLDGLYSLCIAPGGRHGGLNDKVVEIFYGNRAIGIQTTMGKNFRTKEKTEIASGATLRYKRTDDGHIICNLYPARSENQRPIEEIILLDYVKNPSDLKKKLKSHWRMFISYMETTCIDGDASSLQFLRAFYLKNFKKYIINSVVQERKIKLFLVEIFKYVFIVGFSGSLILLITLLKDCSGAKEDKAYQNRAYKNITELKEEVLKITDHLDKTNKKLGIIIDVADKANEKLVHIKLGLDSLEMPRDDMKKASNKANSADAKSRTTD